MTRRRRCQICDERSAASTSPSPPPREAAAGGGGRSAHPARRLRCRWRQAPRRGSIAPHREQGRAGFPVPPLLSPVGSVTLRRRWTVVALVSRDLPELSGQFVPRRGRAGSFRAAWSFFRSRFSLSSWGFRARHAAQARRCRSRWQLVSPQTVCALRAWRLTVNHFRQIAHGRLFVLVGMGAKLRDHDPLFGVDQVETGGDHRGRGRLVRRGGSLRRRRVFYS